ncbi:MAG: hypothetical protein KA163_07750 [Bacteroidia bacterium]|nr:hypothetical protein [Bacteroidia bacterium]
MTQSVNSFAQDIIMKHDGDEIKSKIVEINESQIKYKRFDYLEGPTIVVSKASVFYIKYENGKKEVFEKANEKKSEPVVSQVKEINQPGIIMKRDGEEISAKIIEVSGNNIKYKKLNSPDSLASTLSKSSVFYIKYQDGKKDVFDQNELLSGDKVSFKKVSFPKINSLTNDDFKVTDWNFAKGKFTSTNADFQSSGKYIYSSTGTWRDESFNYLDYPAIYTSSNNNLSEFKSIHVLYSNDMYGKFYFAIKEGGYSFRNDVYSVLKAKGAKKVSINQYLASDDSLSAGLTLQLNIDDINIAATNERKKGWPSYIKCSLNVLGADGQLIQEYKQVVFVDLTILSRKAGLFIWTVGSDRLYVLPASEHAYEFTKATIGCVFSSLVNQFLNDDETIQKLNNFNISQKQIAKQNYSEVNKLQLDLLNIRYKKIPIIDSLSLLGVQMDGIKYTKLNINDIRATPSYNPYVSQQTSYQAAQTLTAAGQLAGSIANIAEANKQRKIIERKNRQISELKLQYQKLDIEERELSKSISPEILKSEAVLLLPNNDQLNKSVESVLEDVKFKTKNAYARNAELNDAISADLNNQSYQSQQQQQRSLSSGAYGSTSGNTALTDAYNNNQIELNKVYNAANPNNPRNIYDNTVNYNNGVSSAESMAVTNPNRPANTNAGAAIKCSNNTQDQWKGTAEYKNYNANPGCGKMAKQSERKLAQLILQNCSEYLPQTEIDGYNKLISWLTSVINGMDDCKSIQFTAPKYNTAPKNNAEQPKGRIKDANVWQ